MEDPRHLAELTIAFSARFGAYPTSSPVVPAAEFRPMVAEAVRAARDAPDPPAPERREHAPG